MSLVRGTHVGPYQILGPLGAGGMGEVYRAHDPSLGREVAVKLLAGTLTTDPDLLARFEREARLLASLNHPNIGSIYGITDHGGVPALVLELVEGVTLADRIARGPIALPEALALAVQMANALHSAHGKSIVHRDFKPSNVKVTGNGQVKVLDFGIAKAMASDDAETALATREGAILGTARYMSPEQARGLAVDARTDIWAFGCVLFEMLAGRAAFDGATTSDVVVAVLGREPDWRALPETTPSGIRRLLHRCLDKNPQRRLHDIADARIEIEDALNPASEPLDRIAPSAPARQRGWLGPAVWVAVGIATLLIGASWRTLRPAAFSEAEAVMRLSVGLGTLRLAGFAPVALSPDGRRMAFAAGASGLYLRDFAQAEPQLLRGTAGAAEPFFSPDGEWVGFYAGGRLRKIAVSGGDPITIVEIGAERGFSWGPDDTIVFGGPNSQLMQVSASGGEPRPLTSLDATLGEAAHRWPHVLPGGRAVLFAAGPGATANEWNSAHVVVQSLLTGERRVVASRGSMPVYTSGFLLYLAGHTLVAQKFDLDRLDVEGPVVTLMEDVERSGSGGAWFAASPNGILIHARGAAPQPQSLAWVARDGTTTPLPLPRALYSRPRLSPDGQRVVVTVSDPDSDVWTFDLTRGGATRITNDGRSLWPLWTPDGSRVVFSSTGGGTGAGVSLHLRRADGSGEDEVLLSNAFTNRAESWSLDGVLSYMQVEPETGADMWTLQPGAKPTVLRRTRFDESTGRFSPDGRWVAFEASDSGRVEVYAQPFPFGTGEPVQVSSGGGTVPVWSKTGRELFFVRGSELWSAEAPSNSIRMFGQPRMLLGGRFNLAGGYDVGPDGRFLVVTREEDRPAPVQIDVMLHWTDALRRSPEQGR